MLTAIRQDSEMSGLAVCHHQRHCPQHTGNRITELSDKRNQEKTKNDKGPGQSAGWTPTPGSGSGPKEVTPEPRLVGG